MSSYAEERVGQQFAEFDVKTIYGDTHRITLTTTMNVGELLDHARDLASSEEVVFSNPPLRGDEIESVKLRRTWIPKPEVDR